MMLSQSQIQSQLNALVMDLVQESRANRRVAEASFGRYRVTAICRMNGIRVQLFEGGSLLDVAWRQADPDGGFNPEETFIVSVILWQVSGWGSTTRR